MRICLPCTRVETPSSGLEMEMCFAQKPFVPNQLLFHNIYYFTAVLDWLGQPAHMVDSQYVRLLHGKLIYFGHGDQTSCIFVFSLFRFYFKKLQDLMRNYTVPTSRLPGNFSILSCCNQSTIFHPSDARRVSFSFLVKLIKKVQRNCSQGTITIPPEHQLGLVPIILAKDYLPRQLIRSRILSQRDT